MKRLLLLLLLAGMPMVCLVAGPAEDLIRNAGTASDYPDAGQVILFDSTRVEVQASGLSHFYTHRLSKVLTPAGALDLAVIRYDYDPLTAWAEIRKVVVYRKDGTKEVMAPPAELDYAAPARAIYWGAREKMVAVGRLEPGDAVEVFLFKKGFTYALLQDGDDDNYIPPMRGQFYDIVPYWTEEPLLEKVYQLFLPADKPLFYKVYHGDLEIAEEQIPGSRRYTFTGKKIMPVKSEPGMVAKSDVLPKLLLSTTKDWEAKSIWFYGVNESFGSFYPTEAIRKKVSEILLGAADENDSIARLTHWCADEIRYSGISMGKGEGYTLHTGEMTFTDRCGVCKDKAGMLITMLRAAGFESYPAMTMAGSRIDRIVADQFNHCVTVVKRRSGEYELLDPTWVPFIRELWSSAEQQQNYLMGVPEGAGLMETPVSDPANHYFLIEGKSEILPDGTLNGEFILTAEGQSDAAVRRMFTGSYRSRWEVQLEKELLKVSPRARIIHAEYGDPYAYRLGPVRIAVRYTIPNYATVTEEEIIFTPVVASHLFKNSQGHLFADVSLKERKYPFRDRCSRELSLREEIILPFACEAVYLPAAEPVESGPVTFTGGYELKGNILKMNQKASYGKRIYEPSEWPGFRQSVLNQNRMAEEKVVLTFSK